MQRNNIVQYEVIPSI